MSDAGDDGPGQREVAYRLFATVYDDADLEHSESEEERAPNYVVTPTGARVNRLFVVGVLTEVEPVSDDVLRGRVVDPTGAFVCYAGQYQPDERAILDRTEPPAFVAVTGKARTFQPEDGTRVFTSVRPESISQVDADARDRWTVDAVEGTLHRVEAMATALALEATGEPLRSALVDRGYDPGLAAGIDLAISHYGTTATYLAAVRDLAVDAARLVAGDADEVPELVVDPNQAGDVTPADLLAEPVEPLAAGEGPSAAPDDAESSDPQRATETPTGSGGELPAEPSAAEPADEAEPTEPSRTEPESSEAESATAEATATEAGTPDAEVETAADEAPPDEEGPGDFEPGDFDLDEAERKEIETEYGTEFQSANEVDEPGEADIETPAPADRDAETESAEGPEIEAAETEATDDAEAPSAAQTDADEGAATDTGSAGDESADEPEAATDEGAAAPDLEDAVVSAMGELDEGDGAERSAVVEAVVERHGADPDAVEDAIQDALMDGRCYEPDDSTLKPI